MADRVPIGMMRDRVRIEKPIEVPDDLGQSATVWQKVDEVAAYVLPLTGNEQTAAKTVQAVTTDRVQMRYREDVEQFGPKWRLVLVTGWGRVLNIESARRIERDRLELLCFGEGRSA